MPTYFVMYAEDLADDDRTALTRRDWKLYPNGFEVSDAWFVGADHPPPIDFHARQVIRLQADDGEAAKALVVDALGRTPEGLEAVRGKD